jgi:glycosyl transferase family 25
MKICVINLEKDIKRRESIVAQMERLSIPFEFFRGYYAKEMSKEEISKHYDKKKTFRNLCLELVPAQIGCALSHAMLYKKIIDDNIDVVCIFEDDVILPETIKDDLDFIRSKMSKTIPQIFLLSPVETNGIVEYQSEGFSIEKYKNGFFASAYVLNKIAAQSLLKNLYPISNVADCWPYVQRHNYVELYGTNPALVEQDQETFGSSTNADLNANNVADIAKTFKYKISRAFWLTIDFIEAFYDRKFNSFGGVVKK